MSKVFFRERAMFRGVRALVRQGGAYVCRMLFVVPVVFVVRRLS